ncbi:hypothetical protein H8E88_04895 [candidate division KSB1 bacterium]|nr:hypothetical protein [candidate division KSB1 bacterium]
MTKLILKIILFLILILPNISSAQMFGTPFNQRDDQYRLLGLKRAIESYEFYRAEFERQKEMFEKNLISRAELDRTRSQFSDAEVNYHQSLLAVLFERQYVAVKNAVKYQDENGRKHVRLTVANTSGGSGDFKKLINIDEELYEKLQPDIVNDVYISLLNDGNAIISQPYEAKIEQLKFGMPQTIDFTLLQDLDAVVVNIVYGNGSQRSPKIFLQKDSSVNKVIVQSEQFSQEVELGGSASYDLTLELFSRETNTFKLEVVNLPSQINRYFNDPTTKARLSQFKFTQQTNTRKAALQVFLPDRPTEKVVIDKPIPFYVLVIPRDQAQALGNIKSKTWTQEEIEKLKIGFVRLELLPRGVGKLLVRAPQLYQSIKKSEVVEMSIDLVNEGSRRLDNVEIEADTPLNWEKKIEPNLLSSLNIREEKRIKLFFTPPEGISVGRYEFRIRTSSLSDDQPVNGEDKIVTVEIQAETNVIGTVILIFLILGIIVGIVVFGIRLSRK